ncbi:hypothetical protein SAMN05428975_0894 [Mucilaginibacter sp. OK268]|uniref:hypothetical protein n=1 Tax=Mucilaginibacter sp. OK268 TaxID=1881048 RepID=UPI0008802129|nr:hypothetical protein [Mucilaginibacter sp. OK268]SDP25833.1 hypothetical protein SAMN05428975_0894 [Mucilaginibacter sp. OK268]
MEEPGYIINLKTITLANGYSLDFEYPILETVIADNVIIIVLDIPFEINYNRNIFAISASGDFLWRVSETEVFGCGLESNSCVYISAIINDDGELVLFNWCSTAVIVDPQTGDILRKYQTK